PPAALPIGPMRTEVWSEPLCREPHGRALEGERTPRTLALGSTLSIPAGSQAALAQVLIGSRWFADGGINAHPALSCNKNADDAGQPLVGPPAAARGQ